MAITGVTEEEYKNHLLHGGTLVFEIEATDIDSTGGFENFPLIKQHLGTGFELKPSPILEEPENSAAFFLYGGSWTRVVIHTCKNGGSIIFKKLPSGRHEAIVNVPAR